MAEEVKTPNLHQRILAVMTDLQYVQKGKGKGSLQYSFVSHDAVSKRIHPLLVKHGITMLPSVENVTVNGNRCEVTMLVTFTNSDDPEQFVTVRSFGFGIDPQDKGPGKAMSYATKYAILKTFVLETGDDPENDNIPHDPKGQIGAGKPAAKKPAPAAEKKAESAGEIVTATQAKLLLMGAENKKLTEKDLDAYTQATFGVPYQSLKKSDFNAVINWISTKK